MNATATVPLLDFLHRGQSQADGKNPQLAKHESLLARALRLENKSQRFLEGIALTRRRTNLGNFGNHACNSLQKKEDRFWV
jgi:hypothetical protein